MMVTAAGNGGCVREVRGMGGDGGRKEHDKGRNDDEDKTMRMMLCPLLRATVNH
jgi:hypothetical protein